MAYSGLMAQAAQKTLSVMAKRGMADVVTQRHRFNQIFIQS
jgi:hypothetical protein